MKKFFKNLARRVVMIYAKRTYRQAVKVANSWYEGTGKRHYVITDPMDERKLVTIDTHGFLEMRHALGIKSKDCTISYLTQHCWYYSPSNADGRGKMPAKDLLVRKYAFINDVLDRAKLLEE